MQQIPTRHRVIGGLAIMLLALTDPLPAASQTKWFKYEGNPVLDVGPIGSWDGALVIPGRVVHDASGYRMWYMGYFGTRSVQTGYATSPDGINWRKYEGNPVLGAGLDAWESVGAAHPYVLQNGPRFEMWYTGADGERTLQIGYAVSPDGVTWEKDYDANPVLKIGPRGSWDSRGLARASVLGPDSLERYQMWFSGEDSSVIQIGYATGIDGVFWTKADEPVLSPGNPGSWDEHSLFFPRVLYNRGMYEMWFGGMTQEGYSARRIGYATSSDGLRWIKSSENPIFPTGPAGSWDHHSVLVGDVLFDGSLYHMWYHGQDRHIEVGAGRAGYAISPRQAQVDIGRTFIGSNEPVRFGISVADPRRLAFSGVIRTYAGETVHRLRFFDDGEHGDRLETDGFFANAWIPPTEDHYVIDFVLEHRERRFVLENAGAFTNIGPLSVERIELIGDVTPNPGDSLQLRVRLRNNGISGTARSVGASLSPVDSCVSVSLRNGSHYGDITPGAASISSTDYPVYLDRSCPPNTDAGLRISISSYGSALWSDTITLVIAAPWWRTGWAYATYALLAFGVIAGTLRYVETAKLRRRIRQLEQEQGLQRERARISQDMHDEVGARLTEISILSELARKDLHDPSQAATQMRKISETSREVIGSIGEIIWAIDSSHDSLDDLVAYLRYYASKYLESTEITLHTSIPEFIPNLHLSAEVRRNIFLVVKEALHNVVKHSGANIVQLRISLPPKAIEIRVEDNGKGFETEQRSRFGQGLRSMQKRMREVGGTFEIASTPECGTSMMILCSRV